MDDLVTIQRRFYELVTSGEGIVGPGLLTGARRLEVYAEMYNGRLHDTLANDYPKLRSAIGVEGFSALVASYLRACPPRSFTLRDAGLALPGFLAGSDDLPPWGSDLAQLERARIEAFDGPDADVLTREIVANVPLEEFPAIRLAWVPASAVLELTWTVDQLWNAVEDHLPVAPPHASARAVLVWRHGTRVFHRTLEEDEAALSSMITAQTTIGELSTQLAERGSPQPEQRLVELLMRWLDAEVLSSGT